MLELLNCILNRVLIALISLVFPNILYFKNNLDLIKPATGNTYNCHAASAFDRIWGNCSWWGGFALEVYHR